MSKPRDTTGLLTEQDISELMGISRTRVWQIIQRAMKKLRMELANDPYVKEWVAENIKAKRNRKSKPTVQ